MHSPIALRKHRIKVEMSGANKLLGQAVMKKSA
jgi:hypothetical protein